MTTIVKIIIGIVVFIVIGTSGASTYYARKAANKKSIGNTINIRLDHIKKGAKIVIDGASISQFMSQAYGDSTTVQIDSLKFE